jgi:hypothetical protein
MKKTMLFSDKRLGTIEAVIVPVCLNTKPQREDVIQVYCSLNDRPCTMYDDDSLNGKVCDNYVDSFTPSYHHNQTMPKGRGSNLF